MRNDGSSVVLLDKALYGTVEAAALWYMDISTKLAEDGFEKNPYDVCVFNKIGKSGRQITIVLHVDDLFVTAHCDSDLDDLESMLRAKYPEITSRRGKIVNYVGMTFDFTTDGEVRITMDSLVDDVIGSCGVTTLRATPATENLFEVRDAELLSAGDNAYFRTYVAKILYLAKRVRPECLAAVSLMSTRVQVADVDELAKLHRVLGYIRATRYRGIALRIGESMTVSGYVDASYGVHAQSGKSHTGCVIVVGEAEPVFVKSTKQN